MRRADKREQEVKILEENIDQSIMREEAELNGAAPSDSGDFRALKLKYEASHMCFVPPTRCNNMFLG